MATEQQNPKKPNGQFQKKNAETANKPTTAPPADQTGVVATPPEKAPEPPKEPEVEQIVPGKILSDNQAIEHFKQNYVAPEGQELAWVAEDRNVFFNENAALSHTNQNKLKLFIIKP